VEAIGTLEKCLGEASLGSTAAEAEVERDFASPAWPKRVCRQAIGLSGRDRFSSSRYGLSSEGMGWIAGRRLKREIEAAGF